MIRRSRRLLAITMSFMMLITSIQIYATEKTTAQVLSFEGEISIKKLGAEKNYSPEVDMELEEGTTITTGKDAEITLLLSNNKEVIVGEKSYVSLEELRMDGEKETTGLRIFSGSIWSSIKEKLGFGDKYEIRTPNSIMGARGTKYIVSYENDDDQAKTDLMVVEGVVSAEGKDSKKDNDEDVLMVKAGHSTTLENKKLESNQEDPPATIKEIDYLNLDLFTVNRILKDMDTNPQDYVNTYLNTDKLKDKKVKLEEEKALEKVIEEVGIIKSDDDKKKSTTTTPTTPPVVEEELVERGEDITVSSEIGDIAVASVNIYEEKVTISVDEQKSLSKQILPLNAGNQNHTWSTDNSSVVSVNADGRIKGLKAGIATVSITSEDGSYTDTCLVTVLQPLIPMEGLVLSEESLEMVVGQALYLTPSVSPINTSSPEVKWDSVNKNIAKVDLTGRIEALEIGKTTISAISISDGDIKAICTVEVIGTQATAFTILESNVALNTSMTSKQLSYEVNPSNAVNKTINWSSSKESVVTVSDGLISVVGIGTAMITGNIEGTTLSDTCSVTVTNSVTVVPLESVTIAETLHLKVNEFKTLGVTIKPADATNQDVTFESKDTSIVTVSKAGVVSGIKPGTTTINVLVDGKSASCLVTVDPIPVTDLIATETTIMLEVNDTKQINTQVLPANATNKELSYTMNKADIVNINESGLITALASGQVEITVQSVDGPLSIVTIIVTDPIIAVTSVELSPYTEDVYVGEEINLSYQVLPDNASNKNVSFTSSDESIATVDKSGHVTTKAKGTTTIKVKTEEGEFESEYILNVLEAVNVIPTSVSISTERIIISVGDEIDLSAIFVPANTSNKTVYWNSGNQGVATIDSKGHLIAKHYGWTPIRVTTQSGGKQFTINIFVVDTVTSSHIIKIETYDTNDDGYLNELYIMSELPIAYYDYYNKFVVNNLGDINAKFNHATLDFKKLHIYLDNTIYGTGGLGFNELPKNQLLYDGYYGSIAKTYEFIDKARPVVKAYDDSYNELTNSSTNLKLHFSEAVTGDDKINKNVEVEEGSGKVNNITENTSSTYTLSLSGFELNDEIEITEEYKDAVGYELKDTTFRLVGELGSEYWIKVLD